MKVFFILIITFVCLDGFTQLVVDDRICGISMDVCRIQDVNCFNDFGDTIQNYTHVSTLDSKGVTTFTIPFLQFKKIGVGVFFDRINGQHIFSYLEVRKKNKQLIFEEYNVGDKIELTTLSRTSYSIECVYGFSYGVVRLNNIVYLIPPISLSKLEKRDNKKVRIKAIFLISNRCKTMPWNE